MAVLKMNKYTKKMDKNITIIQTSKGENQIKIEGFSPFEVLGILRYYEKYIWLQMQNLHKQLDKK